MLILKILVLLIVAVIFGQAIEGQLFKKNLDLKYMTAIFTACSAFYLIYDIAVNELSSTQAIVNPIPTPVLVENMVFIKGGCYLMGSPSGEKNRDDNEDQHKVCVEGFYMGKYEVTVGQYKKFITDTNYSSNEKNAKGCYTYENRELKKRSERNWENPGFSQSDDEPVVCVSWNDARAYTKWLSKETGKNFRLPTEAEWEYAASAGTATTYYWGGDENYRQICAYANVHDKTLKRLYSFPGTNSECDDGYAQTAPVGSFKPNAWGLYDMSGNVWEWTCSDLSSNYSGDKLICNNNAKYNFPRIIRGGSWEDGPSYARSASHGSTHPTYSFIDLGFRLARSP